MGGKREKGGAGERTLLVSILMSAPGPVLTGISMAMSLSVTQIADFVRRTTELFAIILSWWVYRRIHRDPSVDAGRQAALERLSNRSTAIAMACAGSVMLVLTCMRITTWQPGGNVVMGLAIAGLGMVANTAFWLRYRSLADKTGHAVLRTQQRLYRAKAFVDLCVVTALLAVAVAPLHPATKIIDIAGSLVVACYLLWSAWSLLRQARQDV